MLDDARNMVKKYIARYNNVRLHKRLGYIAPIDKITSESLRYSKSETETWSRSEI